MSVRSELREKVKVLKDVVDDYEAAGEHVDALAAFDELKDLIRALPDDVPCDDEEAEEVPVEAEVEVEDEAEIEVEELVPA